MAVEVPSIKHPSEEVLMQVLKDPQLWEIGPLRGAVSLQADPNLNYHPTRSIEGVKDFIARCDEAAVHPYSGMTLAFKNGGFDRPRLGFHIEDISHHPDTVATARDGSKPWQAIEELINDGVDARLGRPYRFQHIALRFPQHLPNELLPKMREQAMRMLVAQIESRQVDRYYSIGSFRLVLTTERAEEPVRSGYECRPEVRDAQVLVFSPTDGLYLTGGVHNGNLERAEIVSKWFDDKLAALEV